MSEAQDAHPTGAAPLEAVVAPTPASAGAMLRAMRESAGVDAGVLASAMKVSLPKLEALEHDRFDQLPDLTFARALASAICRAFGADPAPVLARMPAIAADLRPPTTGEVNEPFRGGGNGGAGAGGSAFSRPLLAVIAVLLLGAALLWLWPTWPIRLGAPEPASEPVAAATAEPPDAAASEPVPAEAPQAATPGATEAAPATPTTTATSAGEGVPTDALLGLRASGESWVTVHDAHGKPLINRALNAGESVALNGDAPLSVTIGRKDAVQATVRGQPFDLKGLGHSTVARFQVK